MKVSKKFRPYKKTEKKCCPEKDHDGYEKIHNFRLNLNVNFVCYKMYTKQSTN